MMKLILVGFAFCVLLAVTEAKRCKSEDDCDETECCVETIFTSNCKKLKEKGSPCVTNIDDLKDSKGRYKFACPCAAGLECKPQKEKDDNGIFNFLNDKCE